MNRMIVILTLAMTMGLFQNCQQAAYSSPGDSYAKSQGELSPVITDDENDEQQTEDGQGTIRQPASTRNPNHPLNQIDEEENSSRAGSFVCILEGPGKSVKLGMSSEGVPRG